ncbi:quinone-dependent dihydroorotate dehydrogenase [Hydrogenophaga sp.]|uniref:quinone-dependent dihydroorotate dehydrogenase n=1 Tax=Hydrogenophaga sp. TaxID=1904254 RepID=UPI0019C24909|nr:quinone-dependent dihydroorotate dehydrogenase [Hydrogenophaga sp.]MBD3892934.1 quinone-dependent dihydroorotate dehydrogenase [Hydrogenophaga sp.]
MSLLPYAFARPLLFGLDPETAHDLTLAGLTRLQHSPLSCLYAEPRVSDPFTLAGLHFPNRVGLAAGLDKNAGCIDALAAMGFGFVEVGTVTPLGQSGNPKPRLFRLPQARALINRLGFNNQGLPVFLSNVQRARFRSQPQPMLLGLNIGKNASTPIERASEDYLHCLDGVYPHADYVTLNVSSPNTQNLRSLQSDAALDALLGAVSERREWLAQRWGRRIPIFLKIAPDLDDGQIDAIATTLLRYGADSDGQANQAWGAIATNTTLSRNAVAGLPHAQEAGGLSGAPLLKASNRVLRHLRSSLGLGFPLIGVGGVMSAADACSKIEAGADLVQIYTGLIYQGPALVRQAAQAIGALRRLPHALR